MDDLGFGDPHLRKPPQAGPSARDVELEPWPVADFFQEK